MSHWLAKENENLLWLAPPVNPLPLKAPHPNGLPTGQAATKRHFRTQVKGGREC